jgi:hypothetical protein
MQEQENAISIDWKAIFTKAFQLAIFISIAVFAPYFGSQLITGTIVNAMLFIAASIMGLEYAVMLCFIPSLISVSVGLLPMILLPMIPFIIGGNILMVYVYSKFERKSFWVGAVPGALVKFIFIWAAGMILANFVLQGVAKNIMLMISWPQFATAIAGATLAFIFLKIVRKKHGTRN